MPADLSSGKNPGLNQLQVDAWRAIEYMVEQEFGMFSIKRLSEDLGIEYSRLRRILKTWEALGVVEQFRGLWSLSSYLPIKLPQKARAVYERNFQIKEKM